MGHLGWKVAMDFCKNSIPRLWRSAAYESMAVEAAPVKLMRRLLYRCSLFILFEDVVQGARERVVAL